MQAHVVRPVHGRKDRTRVGRGNGSGHGTYSGKGRKGQKARTGRGHIRPGFEGGQNPQVKGLPKLRGFTNIFRKEFQIVNVDGLARLPEEIKEVTPQVLEQYGLVHTAGVAIKVLAQGEVNRAFQVQATKFSQSARAKIEAAGGSVKEA